MPHPEDDPNTINIHTDYVEGHFEFLFVPGGTSPQNGGQDRIDVNPRVPRTQGFEDIKVQPTCKEFVAALTKIVSDIYGSRHKYMGAGVLGYSMAHDTIGVGMVNRAVANVDVKGRGYLKGPDLPKGFMQSLIDNGQGGDVYHHIEFVAGNSFLGTSGRVANAAFIGVDFRQAKSGRRESITELRDDLAGLQAGKAMLAAYNRGKFDNLDATLRGILCVPE